MSIALHRGVVFQWIAEAARKEPFRMRILMRMRTTEQQRDGEVERRPSCAVSWWSKSNLILPSNSARMFVISPIGVTPMHLFKSPMLRICEPFANTAQNDAEDRSRYGEAAYGRSRRQAFGYKRPLVALAPMEDLAVVEASRYDSEHAA
jgi:hypothetical protein